MVQQEALAAHPGRGHAVVVGAVSNCQNEATSIALDELGHLQDRQVVDLNLQAPEECQQKNKAAKNRC